MENIIYPNGTLASAPSNGLKGWETDLALRVAMPEGNQAEINSCIFSTGLIFRVRSLFFLFYRLSLQWCSSGNAPVARGSLLLVSDPHSGVGHRSRFHRHSGQSLLSLPAPTQQIIGNEAHCSSSCSSRYGIVAGDIDGSVLSAAASAGCVITFRT